MIFDQLGNRKVDYIQNSGPLAKLLKDGENESFFLPGSKEQHVYVSKNVVNNGNFRVSGKEVRFGVATGDPRAEDFLRYGASSICPGQLAFFYTDGFIPFACDPAFVSLFFSGFSRRKVEKDVEAKYAEEDNFCKEKSLIALFI